MLGRTHRFLPFVLGGAFCTACGDPGSPQAPSPGVASDKASTVGGQAQSSRHEARPPGDAASEVWAEHDQRPSGGGNGAVIEGDWAQYSVGGMHSCGVRKDGTASCWGSDKFGQKQLPEGDFIQLAAGGEHSCGLQRDGGIRCWGNEHAGATTPPDGSFTDLQAGWGFNCALSQDGTVACWGFDGAGQASPPSGTFTQISVGYHHACGLRPDGTAACWGRNDYGQVLIPEGEWVHVSAGELHSCVLRSDGALRCWGDDHHEATKVPLGKYDQVSAGYWHTCALRSSGNAACWGHDGVFQASPPQGAFTSIRSGFYHSCGQRPEGQLECWGWNYNHDHLAARVEGGGTTLQGDELFSDRYQAHMCPFESLGLLYLLQERPDEAKDHLSSALEAQSYWEYDKHLALAEIMIEEGELDKAAQLVEDAIEQYAPQAQTDPQGDQHAQQLRVRIEALRQQGDAL